jgi:DNA polymerase (family 10)
MKMNEYGLFRERPGGVEELIECGDEADIFSNLGLDFIPPELREDHGEIHAAEEHSLPELVAEKDIRGVFHVHTDWSDGANTIEQMAEAARDMGWEYLGIADHSKSSYWANGLSEDRLRRQIEDIHAVNDRMAPFRVLAGSEVDIMADGALDFSEELLSQLDYVVISIHQHFTMPEKEMTARMLHAMQHPRVTMIGHLTGRLLLQREPYALDVDAVIAAAAENGIAIELNANPYRLDMDWRNWIRTKGLGVGCCINPDAHSVAQLAFTEMGVKIARKGWLTAQDVWNTRTLREIDSLLRGNHGRNQNTFHSAQPE